ncbi:MAG: M1 family metallopeptidase [Flavobacteriales bacterium]|nr:M1 family metallopeptidase [Flavobacteriales bacterium]
MRNSLLSLLTLFSFLVLKGQDYFQQEVNYNIEVELDDVDHFLHGYEKLEYHNNAPNMIKEIYFHIWPNAYKDNSTALNRQKKEGNDFGFNFSKVSERGYLDSLSFLQDGEAISFDTTDEPDIIILRLKKPILSGESSIIETPFRVKVPIGSFSRLGHTGQSYYITQWYPKPAVFDNDGWHQMPYLDQGEFYSEYGSFEVSITLPENYVVGATGDLQEESEKQWLMEKVEETMNKSFGEKDGVSSTVASADKKKTITFIQDNVHDHAWFADKKFNVLHDTLKLPGSQEIVDLWAMFTNENHNLWRRATEYLKDGVYYYSLWNGDYPYKHCTAVDGTISAGGGMEYPNITIIGNSQNAKDLERVIVHEVGHNWFYGILGTNERSYPWLDEGINSYYEHRYFDIKYPDEPNTLDAGLIEFDMAELMDLSHYLGHSRNSEQPIQYHADHYTSLNYGIIVYEKASFAMKYLSFYLGEELFDKCMQTYFDEWKFRHPGPNDLQAVFETTTGKDLAWFFDELVMRNTSVDHKLCSVHDNGKTAEVEIKNRSEFSAPISVGSYKDGKLVSTKWVDPFQGKTKVSFPSRSFDEVRLDPKFETLQSSRKNDRWTEKGVVKTWEPLSLRFGSRIREIDKSHLYFLPTIGWNKSDKIMPGFALHNLEAFPKTLEFNLHPMYSFETSRLNGYAKANANIKPNFGALKWIEVFGQVSAFSFKQSETEKFNYRKWAAGFNMQFRPKRLKANNTFDLNYRYIHIEDVYDIDEVGLDSTLIPFDYRVDTMITRSYHDISFIFQDKNSLLRNRSDVNFRIAEGHSRLTLAHKSRYFYSKKKSIDLRVFAGRIFDNGSIRADERLFLTASNNRLSKEGKISNNVDGKFRSANQDYLYDDVVLARTDTEGFLGRQLFMGQGGFKAPVAGLSSGDLLAFNFEADLPLPIGLGLFYSMGWSPIIEVTNEGQQEVMKNYSEFGLKYTLARDYLVVYFPLVFDVDGDGEMDQSDFSFGKTISFQLELKELSLRSLRKKIPL